jgi:hypothetical protein
LLKRYAFIGLVEARTWSTQAETSYENYARANGLDDPAIAAVSRFGRVLLSPTLCAGERARLPGVLTHELSHAHLFGWRSSVLSARPPSWFTEGLAVMVLDGGGAEGVNDAEAAEAIVKGYAIVVTDEAGGAISSRSASKSNRQKIRPTTISSPFASASPIDWPECSSHGCESAIRTLSPRSRRAWRTAIPFATHLTRVSPPNHRSDGVISSRVSRNESLTPSE